MKKNPFLLLLTLFVIFSYQCRKSQDIVEINTLDPELAAAIRYAQSSLDNSTFKNFDTGKFLRLDNAEDHLPTFIFSSKQGARKLLIGKNASGFTGNFFEYSNQINGYILTTESFDKKINSAVWVKAGKIVKIVDDKNGRKTTTIYRYKEAEKAQAIETSQSVSGGEFNDPQVLPEVTVYGTPQGSPTVSLYSLFYYTNQNPGYLYTYSNKDPNVYGMGGGSTYNINSVSAPPASESPSIGNIIDYLKCFTNVVGSNYTYKITVFVDQPNPNSRDAWGFSPNFNVGHTWLGFEQTGPNGTIRRNVGFYPNSTVKPGSPQSQGVLKNDETRSYDVALTVSMTNSSFFTALNWEKTNGSASGYMYNLNFNNCTTYAGNTIAATGLHLPMTTGEWLGGSGKNPGDCGQDIRAMTLQSNMTRSLSNTAHPNTGTCN